MCIVSDKIKFCTCKSNSPEKLANYWILQSYNKNKESTVIGQTIMPYFDDPKFEINNHTLASRLNEKDSFDVLLNSILMTY